MQFVYVKHLIIGDSILYGTDDLTDWPWEEWRHCPDTTVVQKRRYLWFQNKRVYFAGQELNDIRREKGLDPVAIDGYVPGIDRPAKMTNWFD